MSKTLIKPFTTLNLKIYGYTLPSLTSHQGLVKVGETSNEDVLRRVRSQVITAGLQPRLEFVRPALRSDQKPFRDKQLHDYFKLRGIPEALRETGATEWFRFGDIALAEKMTDEYIALDYEQVQRPDSNVDYVLRKEQAAAVEATLNYIRTDPAPEQAEFLWNAKPRFGKTLTSYDLARKMGAQNVLIVTNRPAIANSWFDDYMKFIAWQEPDMRFVSETDALSSTSAMTRKQFLEFAANRPHDAKPARCIAFLSLQDLKGARFAGGLYDKLEWVPRIPWDLLVIDEAHEGVDTLRTDRAFDAISRRFTLHLSGTPFKAIASQKFSKEQIYNWSYLDEQQAKVEWEKTNLGTNPYAALPTLNLFTYQMSRLVEQQVSRGKMLEDGTNLDYAFDLGEFFSTNQAGKFVYEKDVLKFLDNLSQGQFPFAASHHCEELAHTFWLLPRVAACKAMEVLLKNHHFFQDYEVVLAAGDGLSKVEEDYQELSDHAVDEKTNTKSYNKVKYAIANHEKTITLSVSQLTTGVTIPEWTGVFMLNNVKSPALYFQAAFRAQNPYEFVNVLTDRLVRKENAYVFDFAPDRTLVLFDDLANNLTQEGFRAGEGGRQENIRELINFFPVIAEDEKGCLRKLDPGDVLTIPSRLKAQEVVKRGFMSNLLFANISAIFAAPQALKDILDKIKPEKNKRLGPEKKVTYTDPSLDEQGNVHIKPEIIINDTGGLFGVPIYAPNLDEILNRHMEIADRWQAAEQISRDLILGMGEGFRQGKELFEQSQAATNRDIKNAQKALTAQVEESLYQYEQQKRQAEQELQDDLRLVSDPSEEDALRQEYHQHLDELDRSLVESVEQDVTVVALNYVEKHLINAEEKKKKTTQDEVRDHLRGFARTIPAFLMAYGTRQTTLMSFEENIHEATFIELTSITKEEFRLLRDGYEDGKEIKQPGFFNQVVFDAAIQEFFDIKERLADYLHTQDEEDIFDYIPPQQTNQIFTPRRVVKMMVDLLEQEAPELFTSMDTIFVDLYSKSGLYMTEIVKRLFYNLREGIPDEDERVRWILEEQVYACAPSNIIYNMVKNYVYSGFPNVDTSKLIQLDLIPAAREGYLAKELWKGLGKEVKFDAIVGNPPYQIETTGVGRQAIPIYNHFVDESKLLCPRYMSFITPARWYAGGFGLNSFRDSMLSDKRIKTLVDFPNTNDAFSGVDIAGGVCYFLWDRDHKGPCVVINRVNNNDWTLTRHLNEFSTFIRDNRALPIVRKVIDIEKPVLTLSETVSPQKPFGLPTNYKPRDSGVPCWFIQKIGLKYASSDDVIDNNQLLDKWKLLIPKAPIAGQTDFSKPVGFYYDGNTRIARPGECCTESFIVAGAFTTEKEVLNFKSYLFTKIVRFLLLQTVISQDVLRNKFIFVPSLNHYNEPYSDAKLRIRWSINDDEWEYIDSKIHNYESLNI